MPQSPEQSLAPRSAAEAVLRRLREAGHTAYFAGGCVRDLLLGREPKDWDIATDAPPRRVRELFPRTQAVGAAFGVILVRHRDSVIEVATFRSDGAYVDGRHPSEVRFTTAEEDATRRDFTINGLFLDPLADGPLENQVIDFVGGKADLQARILRAIGNADARFEEDHLRLLRAVRFAARFGFQIEPETAQAMRRHAPQLVRISPERIAEELRIMLTPSTRVDAYRLLDEFGLRGSLFRFLETMGTRRPKTAGLPSVFEQLAPGESISIGLALAAAGLDHQLHRGSADQDVRALLIRAAASRLVRALRQSLKISNDESGEVEGALEGLFPLLGDAPPTVALMKRFLARPTAPVSRVLLQAMRKSVLDTPRVRELQERLAELEKTDVAPPPLITGDDLAAAGFTPGPLFKRVLDAVYDAQLEDRVKTREEAMALAASLAK